MSTTFTATEHLQARCPPLYDLGSGVYTYWLEDASNALNILTGITGWGTPDRRALAQALLAAHNWARDASAAQYLGPGFVTVNSPGSLTAQTTGAESVAFGNPGIGVVSISLADLDLSSTIYGRQFLSLRDTRPAFRSFAVRA